MKTEKVIGIAAGRKYDNYLKWLLQSPGIKVIKLSYEDNNFSQIEQCDALVLSGGEDVHPRFYGKAEYVSQYKLDDVDEARDEFEMGALEYADRHGMPVLGICRGLQLGNVFFRGTLVPDIRSSGKPDHTKFGEGQDRYHGITVVKDSLMQRIAGTNAGEVNSAHHQSVDTVAPGFMVNALSADGVVEGMERKDAGKYPFMLFVQWHPERMKDQSSPFSKNIRERFLNSISSR